MKNTKGILPWIAAIFVVAVWGETFISSKVLLNAGLSSRMQEIEEIKAIHDASVRRNRHALVISFIAGLVIGAGVLALFLFKPDFIQLSAKEMIASATIFLDKFKLLICLLIAAASVLLSLIPLRLRE